MNEFPSCSTVLSIEHHFFVTCPHQSCEDEHLSQLSKECSLSDMLAYDDADRDTHLNLNEFYAAFSKLYSQYNSSLLLPPLVY